MDTIFYAAFVLVSERAFRDPRATGPPYTGSQVKEDLTNNKNTHNASV